MWSAVGVSMRGRATVFGSTPKRSRAVAAHSTPVPQAIPSEMIACGSPSANRAPGTKTGRYTRFPAATSFWSRSPPWKPAIPARPPAAGVVEKVPKFG